MSKVAIKKGNTMGSPELTTENKQRLANEIVEGLDVHGLLNHLRIDISELANKVKENLLADYDNDVERFEDDWEEYIG
jgi:hypothetical protein